MDDASANCPIISSVQVFAGTSAVDVMTCLTDGPARPSDIMRQHPYMGKRTLTVRLRELEGAGLIERRVLSTRPIAVEYALTDKGRESIRILQELEALGNRLKRSES